MTDRLGLLGGSFDPVHEGHLSIARHAARALRLERVLLIPAWTPPHKQDRRLASAADRWDLLQLACADDPLLEPCDVELARGGVSWSIDTARALHAERGDVALFSIIGGDTLADLPTWREIRELSRLVTFCPLAREGQPADPTPLTELLGAEVVARIADHVVEAPLHPASSTAIRAALLDGEEPPHLPEAVRAEIRRRGLYAPG